MVGLTKHLRRIPNARHFGFASTSVFTAQYFKFGGLRCSPLNAALCDKAKFLGFSKFNHFGNSLFGFGKSAFSAQILESFKP
ncbi:hypothetical protein [Vibrio parahaemolyticus]|uniref:hypothetical protein n=1 Tax=Vibrio parahaemolyticus TaxID=670 RepID=UPI002362DAB6|nr:hypothetical protein [Vibrio parahaemolyticus]MDG2594851.1 hypothetical protein [Vibrio parahaemolyticus]